MPPLILEGTSRDGDRGDYWKDSPGVMQTTRQTMSFRQQVHRTIRYNRCPGLMPPMPSLYNLLLCRQDV
jgi:hypothetical protein